MVAAEAQENLEPCSVPLNTGFPAIALTIKESTIVEEYAQSKTIGSARVGVPWKTGSHVI
jgi:hypothetical protein